MSDRAAFEEWAASPPFEKDVRRYPDNPTVSPWPGQYRDVNVEFAWIAWQVATKAAKEANR